MRRRIILCLGTLLALCLLGDAVAIISLDQNARQLVRLAESHRIQSMRMSLGTEAVRLQGNLLESLAGSDVPRPSPVVQMATFAEALTNCGKCHHQPAVDQQLSAIRDTFAEYQTAIAGLPATDSVHGVDIRHSTAFGVTNKLIDQTTGISDRAMQHLATRTSHVASKLDQARLVLWATCAAALICGGFVALHLQRRLTQPVAALLTGIERVRRGDVSHRFTIDADEEFRLLGNAFNQAYEGLKQANEGMLQMEKMAAVGNMAAGVAHEVGNPLASISSIVQLMRRHCQAEEQRQQIELIMNQIARISRIVRELLKFSRPARDMEHTEVQIEKVLEQAATLLGYDERARKVRIVQEIEPDLGVIRGDADRLLLVFTNVMLNAFDALDQVDGERLLKITARCNGEALIVRFEDNGPGMTKEQLNNVFQPFYTTKGPDKGTGLGLWICYQIVRAHKGKIELEGRRDQGTSVTVTLPWQSFDVKSPAPSPARDAALV